MNLQNKTVLITGSSGGIGAEIVKRFLEFGAVVYGIDRGEEFVSGGFTSLKADITDAASLNLALAKIPGKVDVVIHCAGVMRRGDILDSSEADYDLVMGVNLKGVWLVQKLVDAKLADGAEVLFVSSRHGFNPKPDPGFYSLSKAALWDFAKILKKSRPNLKVKIAFPGPVDTGMSWLDVPAEQIAEKKTRVVTAEYISGLLAEMILDDGKNYLMYDEENLSYSFKPSI